MSARATRPPARPTTRYRSPNPLIPGSRADPGPQQSAKLPRTQTHRGWGPRGPFQIKTRHPTTHVSLGNPRALARGGDSYLCCLRYTIDAPTELGTPNLLPDNRQAPRAPPPVPHVWVPGPPPC